MLAAALIGGPMMLEGLEHELPQPRGLPPDAEPPLAASTEAPIERPTEPLEPPPESSPAEPPDLPVEHIGTTDGQGPSEASGPP